MSLLLVDLNRNNVITQPLQWVSDTTITSQ